MVAYLINIRAEIQASAQHVSFRICLGVTGEDETGVSIGDLEGDGPVVQVIAIIGDGTQDCEGSIAQRVGLAHFRNRDGKPFLIDGCQHILKSPGVGGYIGEHHGIDGDRFNDGIHGTDVILMRMRADHIIQMGKSCLILDVIENRFFVIVFSGVDEHGVIPAGDQCRVCLTHIQKMNLHSVVRIRGKAKGHK